METQPPPSPSPPRIAIREQSTSTFYDVLIHTNIYDNMGKVKIKIQEMFVGRNSNAFDYVQSPPPRDKIVSCHHHKSAKGNRAHHSHTWIYDGG